MYRSVVRLGRSSLASQPESVPPQPWLDPCALNPARKIYAWRASVSLAELTLAFYEALVAVSPGILNGAKN